MTVSTHPSRLVLIYLYSVFKLSLLFPPSPLQSIGKLRQLRYLDLAKNRIETLDTDISGCEALEDLLLSSNMLQHLPDSIGAHSSITDMHGNTDSHVEAVIYCHFYEACDAAVLFLKGT